MIYVHDLFFVVVWYGLILPIFVGHESIYSLKLEKSYETISPSASDITLKIVDEIVTWI